MLMTGRDKGYSSTVKSYYPGWDGEPDTPLIKLVKEGYEKASGKETAVTPIHAGLECSWFSQKRKSIQIVAIGPTINNPHTANEVLYIDTVETCVKTILYALENTESLH